MNLSCVMATNLSPGIEQHLPPGLEKAIGEMKNAESARVTIKNPKYGFGEAGLPDLHIPPNAELSYFIRLNSFQLVSPCKVNTLDWEIFAYIFFAEEIFARLIFATWQKI